jgi:hypothetical protein
MQPNDLMQLNLPLFQDVAARIGLALWHSQAFEDTLCHFVALTLKLPASRAEAEVREVMEKTQAKTLGSLIAELRKANTTNSVSAFERRITHYLNERNWLVHSSWRQHHRDLFNSERVQPLVHRLDAIADEALALQKLFGQLVYKWTLAQGVDPGLVEAETWRIMMQGGQHSDPSETKGSS